VRAGVVDSRPAARRSRGVFPVCGALIIIMIVAIIPT
jgi:hypothetical protein